MKDRTKMVSFRDRADLIKQIDQIAAKRGYDRSDFIRGALREKIEKESS